MSKNKFSREQISELLKNKNIVRCSEKTIACSQEFKIMAIKQYQDECLSAKQIFQQAGFDLAIIGKDRPKDLMREWIRILKTKGIGGLIIENRGGDRGGGRARTKDLTDKEKIKRLELKILYLKAENDFLAKLRAKRAE